MTAKFVLLYKFGGETKIGRQRMEETKNMSYFSMLTGYKEIFMQILRSSRMRLVVYIMTLTNILLIATTNFFSLYITESLHSLRGVPAESVSPAQDQKLHDHRIFYLHSQPYTPDSLSAEKPPAGYAVHNPGILRLRYCHSQERRAYGTVRR